MLSPVQREVRAQLSKTSHSFLSCFVCVLFCFLISTCIDADSCTWKTSQDIVQKLNATPKFCFSWLLPSFYPPTAEYIVSEGSLDAPSFQWSVCRKFSLWSVKCYFVDYYDGNYYESGFLNFPIAFNHESDSTDSCITRITGSSQINILISNVREYYLDVSGRDFIFSFIAKDQNALSVKTTFFL